MAKTPTCSICSSKLYVIDNQRKKLGYICPKCDYSVIKNPSENLEKLRNDVNAKINTRSISGKNPKFGKHRQVTICECGFSKYIECKKVRYTKQKKELGENPRWRCKCSKCGRIWYQSAPKIKMA